MCTEITVFLVLCKNVKNKNISDFLGFFFGLDVGARKLFHNSNLN